MEFTETDVASLGRKLDALDLTAGERAALGALLDAAASADVDTDEVAGFAWDATQPPSFGSRIGSILFFDEAEALFGKRTQAAPYIGETEKRIGG